MRDIYTNQVIKNPFWDSVVTLGMWGLIIGLPLAFVCLVPL